MELHDAILQSDLFKGVDKEALAELLQNIFFSVKRYEKGEMIVFQGDVCDSLFIIYKGRAVGEMFNKGGKSIIIEEMSAPKLLAPAFLFADQNHYPVGVKAIEKCEVMIIPKDELTHLMQKNSIVLSNFLGGISSRTVFLGQKLKLQSLSSLKGKIAHFILDQCEKTEQDNFEIPMTQQELADTFGVARPSLTRALLEMAKEDIIAKDNKNIRIINRKALRDLAE